MGVASLCRAVDAWVKRSPRPGDPGATGTATLISGPPCLPPIDSGQMPTNSTGDRGGRAGSSDPLGSIGWTERTGGVLTARECVTLARPLLREELGILAGLLAM